MDQTDHILELVNEWYPDGKFRKVDTPLNIKATYKK